MNETSLTLPLTLSAASAVRLYALEVLKCHNGDRVRAAKALDLDPSTLKKWMMDLEKTKFVTIPPAPRRQARPRSKKAVELPAGMTV